MVITLIAKILMEYTIFGISYHTHTFIAENVQFLVVILLVWDHIESACFELLPEVYGHSYVC